MRFLSAVKGDIKYQIKYGFYFLYAFISIVYMAVLALCPAEYKKTAASLIILTDPTMLGAFFIGGIWLLEKGEGLHGFWNISPLKPVEYVLSKAVSLAIISTLAANTILAVGLAERINCFLLSLGVFTGAMLFTLIGLMLASYSRSVNNYMLTATFPLTVLLLPPIVSIFGFSTPVFYLTPGMAVLQIINRALNISAEGIVLPLAVIFIWLALFVFISCKRIPLAYE